MKFLIILMLFIVGISSCLLAMLMIPVYARNQRRRENILKIFATISSNNISKMIRSIDHSTNLIGAQPSLNTKDKSKDSFKASIKTLNEKKSNNPQNTIPNKRKNISHTNRLPTFNLQLLVLLTLCLGLTFISPITNYYVNTKQI